MSTETQPEIRTNPYQSPLHNYGSSIVVMTNPDDELYKMELTFRSETIDKKGNTKKVGDPLMNELGINSVVGIVQSLVNRVTVMSNLNKYDVPMMIDFLGDTLAQDLMMNRNKYEIRTTTARTKIYFTALSTAFVTMKRAFEQGEKIFWKGSQQEITTRVEQTGERKGMFASMLGWGR
jgi:hypothetical protein